MQKDKVFKALKKYQTVSRQARTAMNRANALQVRALLAYEAYERAKNRMHLKAWKQFTRQDKPKEKQP